MSAAEPNSVTVVTGAQLADLIRTMREWAQRHGLHDHIGVVAGCMREVAGTLDDLEAQAGKFYKQIKVDKSASGRN